jgi:DTW domain-containing protein YfiP
VIACTCGKPPAVCVCDRIEPMEVNTKVLVLQHPREQDRLLGTVPILERAIGAVRRVGLSWPNLAAALGEPATGRWGVLWPLGGSGAGAAGSGTPGPGPGPGPVGDRTLEGIVVLDGTWTQAKALWWRNAWLLKLERIVVQPKEPSIYGKLRKEPRAGFVSTLEAVADALAAHGEREEIRVALRRAMRTMVQRARDAPSEP